MSSIVSEMSEKERRVLEFLSSAGLDAVAFTTQSNFAWATCGGANFVGTASDIGSATALFTRDGSKYVISDNIESGRLQAEELSGLGFEPVSFPWFEGRAAEVVLRLGGEKVGSDTGLPGTRGIDSDFAPYRYSLTPAEVERYRWVGRNTAECMDEACREVEPGVSEHEIAALLDGKLMARGMVPNVTLIAADERIERFRHPIPTEKKLERYVMLVTGARRWGLVVSMSRLVHFGPIPDELRRKHKAVVKVDATFLAGTVPGASVGAVFQSAVRAYEDSGFGDEWKLHHQGGPTGYRGRDYRASAGTSDTVRESQAFAWNPSITGTKSEDTVIASSDGLEILSTIPGWPMLEVEAGGQSFRRPDILEIDR